MCSLHLNQNYFSWHLAGRAETLLNNLDEQTGAVLRNGNGIKPRPDNSSPPDIVQKKKFVSKNKRILLDNRSSFTPVPKNSPINQPRSTPKSLDNARLQDRRKKSAGKKSPQYTLHNNGLNTVEDDCESYGMRQRRFSLPTDLEFVNHENITFDMQNLEVENAMLKNEINVVNREVSDLLDKLRTTENELKQVQTRAEAQSKINQRLNLDKDGLLVQLDDLRSKIEEVSVVELSQYRSDKQALDNENRRLQERNCDLQNDIRNLRDELHDRQSQQNKLENELRHTQTQIYDLEHDLEKRKLECVRLENEWEAYKLRVKSMLFSKDNEIKALRDGSNLSEDTKQLIEQIDRLKEERDDLSQGLSKVKTEFSEMKHHMAQLEARHSNAERVIAGLRDALKEERGARNKAETHANSLSKEIQTAKLQSGQTIANLRAALHNKEEELLLLKENSAPTTDTSALNVGDYDVMHSIENEKIQYLTQTVVQKQGRIDSLLADNNMLKIQLDKLETKYKTEMSFRARSHVVNVQDERRNTSPLAKLSLRMGLMLKRFPLIRIFIVFYMIGLHFWVMTVLLTSTPENYIVRPKS
ncbi:golgin subfamily A member 5 isoform X1 [Pieris brassicae]|uniref:golgin subfamily A member 5 isoform X1 n=1 Tax=Pieris brassicae TaxID=7116 RepID=UPI001E660456|nr:golgin subfamily A member 5 isoform X1 [Pieris brassicae]